MPLITKPRSQRSQSEVPKHHRQPFGRQSVSIENLAVPNKIYDRQSNANIRGPTFQVGFSKGASLNVPNKATDLQSSANIVKATFEVGCSTIASQTSGSKKRKRGHTCMPKVWGQDPEKLIVISLNNLGQPNDKATASTLAHFLGTIARNGKYCPLHYTDWRLMPSVYKEEMIRVVKTKFELPQGDSYILQSINKKWRNWKSHLKSLKFDPAKPMEQQLLDIPERVTKDQYKAVLEHWLTEKTMEVSGKRKESRGKLNFMHRLGKRSIAVLKEIVKEHLGRYPTRAELFKECYYASDNSKASVAIRGAIEQMEGLGPESPLKSPDKIPNSEDNFAKVMGKDKDGHLRLYGMGVKETDVYGKKPSRDALLRQTLEYEKRYMDVLDKCEALNTQVEKLTTMVAEKSHSNAQHDDEIDRGESSGRSNSRGSRLASMNNRRSTEDSRPKQIQIQEGSYVVLKDLVDINEIVATGIVCATHNIKENGMVLGRGFCQVTVQCAVKRDAELAFPRDFLETVGDVIGVPIAWPLFLVALDEDANWN